MITEIISKIFPMKNVGVNFGKGKVHIDEIIIVDGAIIFIEKDIVVYGILLSELFQIIVPCMNEVITLEFMEQTIRIVKNEE